MLGFVAPEAGVAARHPLRLIRALLDWALTALGTEFGALYSHTGRPSILPPRKNFRSRRVAYGAKRSSGRGSHRSFRGLWK